jgi:transposase InsO family protein
VQEWIAAVGAKTAYIERGSPWENGYIESFNARLRDEHANYIHVDLAERAHGYRVCQWDVRENEVVAEVPIPPPKTLAEPKLSKRPAKAMPARR